MNASNDGMLLHLAFDDIAAGRIEDLTDNDNDGAIEGAPQLIPDARFGSCLSFNEDVSVSGSHILVQDVGLVGPNPPHTIEAWFRVAGWLPGREWMLVLGQAGPGAHHWLVKGDGSTQLGVWSGAQVVPRLPIGEWFHLAVTFDGRMMTAYLNGVPQGVAIPAQFNFTGKDLALAKSLVGEYDYRGKIAGVRVYGRALSADEINRDMADDQTAAAAFRQVSPIDFDLLDQDDNPVLYIEDDLAAHTTKFEIANISRKDLTLIKPTAAAASPENSHFELKFRPGTLSRESIAKIAVADPAWNLARTPQPDGSLSLYFLATAGGVVKSGEKLKLALQNVSASPDAGARGTRVELKYQQLQFPDASAPISGSRLEHLSIVNQTGKKNLPLHVGIVGSNTVLNDGQTGSTLTLRITNTLKDKSLALAPGKTKFILSFDVDPVWGLGTTDQVDAITIEGAGWTATKARLGITPQWTLTHATKSSLAPGESMTLSLSGIKTASPGGQTNLYLRYENVPGYWDGQFVCLLEKAPLVIAGQNVGIGLPIPAAPLHVKGMARVDGRIETDAKFRLMVSVADYPWNEFNRTVLELAPTYQNDPIRSRVYLYAPNNYYHNEPAITLAANYGAGAMVGISNTAPSENLDVTGNAAVSGNLIAGRVSLARVNEKRGALFLAMAGDFNHALYNNFSNLDGEGSWDGSKWNVFAGLNIRVGAGNAKKSALYINETGNVGIGTTQVPERLNVEGAIRAAGLSLGSSYRFNKMLAGHALCGGNNGGIKEVRIDFPEPFADTPQAIVTPRSEGYYEDTFAITVKYIDRTHFKVNIMRLDSMRGGWAQNLRLDWIAWGR